MSALLYLDLCYARNVALSIVRSPRIGLWLGYAGLIGFMIVMRAVRHRSKVPLVPTLPMPLEVALGGACLVAAGIAVLLFASIPFRAFRSRAEARMLCSCGLPSALIVLWLQARRLFPAAAARAIPALLIPFIVGTSSRVGLAALAQWLVATLLFFATLSTLQAAVFLVGRRAAWPLKIGACIVAAVGAAFVALGVLSLTGSVPAATALSALPWTPAATVRALMHGQPAALAGLALVPLALVAVTPWAGRDALPELYESTVRFSELREARGGTRAPGGAQARRYAAGAGFVPGGAASILWRDWLGFRRSRMVAALWLLLCVVAAAAGVAAGLIRRDRDLSASLLVNGALVISFLVVTWSTIGLARDVAKPLWWLSSASLRERLWLWTLSRSWRIAVPLGIVSLVAALGRAQLVGAALAFPAAFAIVWSLTAIGVALYPIFPAPPERGPVALLRALVTFVFLVPSGAAFAISLIVVPSVAVATLVALGVLVLEGGLLLEFGGAQIGRNSAATASAD
jgi:hypothetical protein